MLTKTGLCGAAMLLICSVAWSVQEVTPFHEGDHTLTLGGGGNGDKDLDNSTLSINVGYSQFITNETAVALRQELNMADAGSDQAWNGSTRFAVDYYWSSGNCKPFLGVNLGYLYGDSVKEQFIAGPEAGIKHFLNESTFLYANVEYQFLFKNSDQANNIDDGRFVYALGLGFRW